MSAQTELVKREIDEAWTPGTWGYTCDGTGVMFCCPGCGHYAMLDHEVSPEGDVTPSVDCPMCEYHETGVKLIGWEPR